MMSLQKVINMHSVHTKGCVGNDPRVVLNQAKI